MGSKGERWGTMSHEKGCVQNKRDDLPVHLQGLGARFFRATTRIGTPQWELCSTLSLTFRASRSEPALAWF